MIITITKPDKSNLAKEFVEVVLEVVVVGVAQKEHAELARLPVFRFLRGLHVFRLHNRLLADLPIVLLLFIVDYGLVVGEEVGVFDLCLFL